MIYTMDAILRDFYVFSCFFIPGMIYIRLRMKEKKNEKKSRYYSISDMSHYYGNNSIWKNHGRYKVC